MDGVLVHGNQPVPGAPEFIQRLEGNGHKFLILTNNPRYTPVDLQHRLNHIGFSVEAHHFFSSAMAVAHFVQSQIPNGSALALGDTGLYQALNDVNYKLTDYNQKGISRNFNS